jgi:hypothetical protein
MDGVDGKDESAIDYPLAESTLGRGGLYVSITEGRPGLAP